MHSLKDVPDRAPRRPRPVRVPGAGRPARRRCSRWRARRLAACRAGARVGTTSLRRAAPGARRCARTSRVEDLRGNVDTRIRRLREGRYDAILLAMAGLDRAWAARAEVTEALDPVQFIPAPGPGRDRARVPRRRRGHPRRPRRTTARPADGARGRRRARVAGRAWAEAATCPWGPTPTAQRASSGCAGFVARPDGSAHGARPRRRGTTPQDARPRAWPSDLLDARRGARLLRA